MKNFPILILFVLPFIAFSISACDNNTSAQQVVEVVDAAAFDFVQNVVSGSVGEKVSENEYLIEFELSPNTVYTSDIPVRFAGSITTESFYNNFNLNFPDLFPNAILSINEGEEVVAIPFEMKNPDYDPSTGILELTVSPLDITRDAGGSSINLTGIDEITSPFGQSSLFIDDLLTAARALLEANAVQVTVLPRVMMAVWTVVL